MNKKMNETMKDELNQVNEIKTLNEELLNQSKHNLELHKIQQGINQSFLNSLKTQVKINKSLQFKSNLLLAAFVITTTMMIVAISLGGF